MPPKFFVILGVSHRVQGDLDFINAFHDPDHEEIVREIITRDNIDFVGEECAVNTTAAGRIAQELLGVGHYLKVDPVLEEGKKRHGIGSGRRCPTSTSLGGRGNCTAIGLASARRAIHRCAGPLGRSGTASQGQNWQVRESGLDIADVCSGYS